MTNLDEAAAAERPPLHTPPRVRLLLSGGGNRALMGSAGTIAYLTQTGWWEAIDEVVSVSGGSATNAALMTGGTETSDRTYASLRAFYVRATTDIGQPWKDPRRFSALAIMLLPLLVVIALVLMAIDVVPGPSVFDTPIIALVLGLIAPTLCSLAIRRGAGAYLRNYLGALSDGSSKTLGDFGSSPRQHVICASGLSTAHPYYLWGGGTTFTAGGDLTRDAEPHDVQSLWGAPLQGSYLVADAVFASASLPTLARVEANLQASDRSELLIDGGVSGIFGSQVSAGMRRQTEHRSSPETGHIIIVDSGRHVRPPSRLGQLMHRLSIGGLLARWLKVSLEANYQRDLLELDDAHLIRIAEGQGERGAGGDDARVRFDELRTRTARMGLANYNSERALNAFVTGWVGAALCLDPSSSVASIHEQLRAAGAHMGTGDAFADYWEALGQ